MIIKIKNKMIMKIIIKNLRARQNENHYQHWPLLQNGIDNDSQQDGSLARGLERCVGLKDNDLGTIKTLVDGRMK